jgi:hypothetical protein
MKEWEAWRRVKAQTYNGGEDSIARPCFLATQIFDLVQAKLIQ